MKEAVRKLRIKDSKAFEIHYLNDLVFDTNWHFHAEYQLFVVLQGRGTRFIGDNIAHFQEGEVVFTGPNIPHLWRNDEAYFDKTNPVRAQGIVIYFPENLFGESLLQKDEMLEIRQLLEKARRGVAFFGGTSRTVRHLMQDLLNRPGVAGIIQLLTILHVLAESTEYQYIASLGYTNTSKEVDQDRMNEVYTYIMQNFKQKISLEQVADIANMSPTSFSRFFKAKTNKSFSSFLSELRIGYACKLLLEDKHPVAQICFESGYNTLSNFNKQFKELLAKTPYAYKKEYLRGIK